MCFFFSLLPASVFTTLSYFVWFAAANSEGTQQQLGIILALWLLVMAMGFVACGAFMTFTKRCPMQDMFSKMHGESPQ